MKEFHKLTMDVLPALNIPDEIYEEVVHMASDGISPNIDLQDSNPADSFDEPQNQEVVSVLLRPKRILF